MRIAFTHNLQRVENEEEAEFDTAETIAAITGALRNLGHEVDPVDVGIPVGQLVQRLERFRPDLVFNCAEGSAGRTREAFYPALYEQLGLPYTGSDPFTCTVTLDKRLSKVMVAQFGVPTPRWRFVESAADLDALDLTFPLIIKPNFEGSSKGITEDSVITDPAVFRARAEDALARYPGGLLVEEFIVGHDVVVPFVEGVSPATGGVLAPVEYRIAPEVRKTRKHAIYDYDLKHGLSYAVEVRVPADVSPQTAAELERHSRRVFEVLGVRDLGRIDFRVGEDGRVWFLEVNALPSLEPGAGIYAGAALCGLPDMESVLDAVIRSALTRRGKSAPTPQREPERLRVGLIFNLKRVKGQVDGSGDDEAEYDSPFTVDSIATAMESFGHEVVKLEATPDLLTRIGAAKLDVAFNMAEGIRGRGREALVPAILELLDIPYTGSDPTTLAISLDKALAKRVVREAGVPTPDFFVMESAQDPIPKHMRFPLIVKPVAEGSSKGVVQTSVVRDEAHLRSVAGMVVDRYRQGALVEAFLPGREFTIAILGGERRLRLLPTMEVVFRDKSNDAPIYTFAHKLDFTKDVGYQVPAEVDAALDAELKRVAKGAFRALGCRDVARVDLRLDAQGRVNFIECNPLPGMTPDFSDLCLISNAAGMEYRALVGEILAPALRRRKRLLRERAGKQRQTDRETHA